MGDSALDFADHADSLEIDTSRLISIPTAQNQVFVTLQPTTTSINRFSDRNLEAGEPSAREDRPQHFQNLNGKTFSTAFEKLHRRLDSANAWDSYCQPPCN
ncbi:hypothetical protein TX24_29200 [Pseudomonas lactis]|nr:hypothetical protein TX24_29200 [Pseudomonas lactis]